MSENSATGEPFKRSHEITVRVAEGLDDLSTVMAIRAAVFLGEEDCGFGEEFDGLDTSATHLIAFRNGEPAGTIRVRWFADFVRFERLAIRKRHRCLAVANSLIRGAMKTASSRGYRTATGLVREPTARLWERRGAERSGDPIMTNDGWLTPMLLPLIESSHNQYPPISVSGFGSAEFEELISRIGRGIPMETEAAHA